MFWDTLKKKIKNIGFNLWLKHAGEIDERINNTKSGANLLIQLSAR